MCPAGRPPGPRGSSRTRWPRACEGRRQSRSGTALRQGRGGEPCAPFCSLLLVRATVLLRERPASIGLCGVALESPTVWAGATSAAPVVSSHVRGAQSRAAARDERSRVSFSQTGRGVWTRARPAGTGRDQVSPAQRAAGSGAVSLAAWYAQWSKGRGPKQKIIALKLDQLSEKHGVSVDELLESFE